MKTALNKLMVVLWMIPLLAFTQGQPNKPAMVTREWQDADGTTISCQIFLPLHYDQTKKYPLVLCMHGAGGMKRAPYTVQTGASTALLRPQMREQYPAFLLVPQTTNGWARRMDQAEDTISSEIRTESTALKLVMRGLAEVMDEYSVDADRIYVSGQSMGGGATWGLIAYHPDIFAAAVPICGGADPKQAAKIRCPVWVFHGAKDTMVPVACSRDMVAALKEAGREVLYTEYPEGDHGIWNSVWYEKELAPWLFSKQRKKAE